MVDDDGRTGGRTPEHLHAISSACKPVGSDELNVLTVTKS